MRCEDGGILPPASSCRRGGEGKEGFKGWHASPEGSASPLPPAVALSSLPARRPTHKDGGIRDVQLQQVLHLPDLRHVVGVAGELAVAQAGGPDRIVDAEVGTPQLNLGG